MPEGGRSRAIVGWGVVAWTAIGIGILLGVVGRGVGSVAGILPFLVMAWLVVFVLNPAVRALARRGVPRRLGATLAFGLAVAVIAVMLAWMVPVAVHQSQQLARTSPVLVRHGEGLFARLSDSTDPVLRRIGDGASTWVRDHAGSVPKELQTLGGAGLGLAHFGLAVVLGGFLGFLLLLSLPEATRGLLALVPRSRRDGVEPTLAEVRRIVSGYVRARLIVSAAVGLIATLGLWAVGMPFWLVLGLVVAVANLIPMLGSWIGGVPVALVALATKPPSFLFVVLAVVIVAHAVDGYVLSPIVLRETTDLHPVVVLLAVLIGAEIGGFWGILAAIPVAGVAQFALRRWAVPRLRAAGATPAVAPHGGQDGT